MAELGGDVVPVSVQFQDEVASTDDYVVKGLTDDGRTVQVSIGVRRNPLVQNSNGDSVSLLRRFLETLEINRQSVKDGESTVCLATSVIAGHAHQLSKLASFARDSVDNSEFRTRIAREGQSNAGERGRLSQLDLMVADILAAGLELDGPPDSKEVVFDFLTHLRVRTLHLEDADLADEAAAIERLAPIASDGSGRSLFEALIEVAAEYASGGVLATEHKVRQRLGARVLDSVVDTSGRRGFVATNVVDRIGATRLALTQRRMVLRSALGLDDTQVSASFKFDPALPDGLLNLDRGRALALEGPLGSGKSDVAIRWLLATSSEDALPWNPWPIWISADTLTGEFDAAIYAAAGGYENALRYELDVVVDGLDERVGRDLFNEAAVFVAAHPTCRIVITTRASANSRYDYAKIPIAPWSREDAKALVGAVARVDPLHVGVSWSSASLESIRRPLFALLAGRHYESAGHTESTLLSTAVRSAIGDSGFESVFRDLAVATVRSNGAVNPMTIGLDGRPLRKSPLVEVLGDKLRFTLAVFEQWFAGQAVLVGQVSPNEYVDSVQGFALWRYSLAMAVATGDAELVDPVMTTISSSNPGAAAWLVREAIGTGGARSASPRSSRELGERAFVVMKSWHQGLKPLSNALRPWNLLGAQTAEDPFERLQLTMLTNEEQVAHAWTAREPSEPTVAIGQAPLYATLRPGPMVGGFRPAEGENWVWPWSLDQFKDDVPALLQHHEVLASSTAPDGIVLQELVARLASDVSGKSELLQQEVSRRAISDSLAALRASHQGFGPNSVLGLRSHKWKWGTLDLLDAHLRKNGAEDVSIDPHPGPDLAESVPPGRFLRYSAEGLLKRLNAVAEAAGLAYTDIVASLLPNWRGMLAHSATFPAVLVGELYFDPVGMGDFGDSVFGFRWEPVLAPDAEPVATRLSLTSERSGFWDRAWGEERIPVVTGDKGRDEFGLFNTVTDQVLPTSVFRNNAATSMALGWITEDLAKLGFGQRTNADLK
jgi:hypothetical protein